MNRTEGNLAKNAQYQNVNNPVLDVEPEVKPEEKVAKRRVLGRGLGSLLGSGASYAEASSAAKVGPVVFSSEVSSMNDNQGYGNRNSSVGILKELAISDLKPSKGQPRTVFEEADMEDLAMSIKASGVLQPILARKIVDKDNPSSISYEIVAGERRWRAAKNAGLETVPVLVKDVSDRESLEIGIVENVQRADLNPIEEAQAYARLRDDFGETQEEIAKLVGKDRASIANSIRLLRLASAVQRFISDGMLSAGHGRALLVMSDEKDQEDLASLIIAKGLSVRAAEKLVKNKFEIISARSAVTTEVVALDDGKYELPDVENRLRRALGTKVSVFMRSQGSGEVRIKFFSQEELESLIERFGA